MKGIVRPCLPAGKVRSLRNTLLIVALSIVAFSQIVNAQIGVDSTKNNGQIDDITEFSTIITVPFTMPDGIKLMTDVYLPMVSDCMLVEAFSGVMIELIPKGTQIIFYDSITPPDTISINPLKLDWNLYDPQNLIPNPNPYQMPLIFTRTPYEKEGADEASLMSILGYIYAMQDMRGRYSSEGVYLPMYSDAWNKNPYHPGWGHVLDAQTPLSDPRHGNKHEDGYNSIQFILDSLKRTYNLYDPDSAFPVSTGNIGTFGASALGNTQYSEAAAHPIDPTLPGMKCLLPIVASNEHFKYTGYNNGVFRDRLVTGWVKGQIFTGIEDDDDTSGVSTYDFDKALGPLGVHNSLHTSWDYDQPNKFDAANTAIDHFSSTRYNNGVAGYYPNSTGRADMDASRAAVDIDGEGDANGTFSRYKNMEVPGYHLFGWWDIFVDGQIETVNYIRKHTSAKNGQLQKMVIGPWVHQTIGSRTSTDNGPIMYPKNVSDVLGFDLGSLGNEDVLPLSDVFTSQIVTWYRYNLNYTKGLGEPKVIIPESKKWQSGGGVIIDTILCMSLDSLRIPSKNFIIPFNDFFNFMAGNSGLPDISVEIAGSILCPPLTVPFTMDTAFPVPAPPEAIFPGLDPDGVKMPEYVDFLDSIPNVQFYVVGPHLDTTLGNYWYSADSFPLVDKIKWTKMYLHQNGTVNKSKPTSDEGYKIYVHDPDDPILTIGGANMIVRTPLDDGNSQGQMNLADSKYDSLTMGRTGVVKFTSAAITEANGYPGDSLCIIGFPVATLYAKSSPGGLIDGPTDTDFFIRILDVYPDGRELFVVSGCVNARARDYVRNLVEHPEWDNTFPYVNDNTPFTNIEIGQIYEYKFKMMPIAYVWGPGHKIKILISSSNYTRYQVNPNLPIEPGDFFRRKPGDGRKYTFEGVEMEARIAVQRIAFSDVYPTNIDLPVFTPGFISGNEDINGKIEKLDALVYPNPASDIVSIYMNRNGSFEITLFNILGQVILNTEFEGDINIEVDNLEKGLYFVEVKELKGNNKIVKKISVM